MGEDTVFDDVLGEEDDDLLDEDNDGEEDESSEEDSNPFGGVDIFGEDLLAAPEPEASAGRQEWPAAFDFQYSLPNATQVMLYRVLEETGQEAMVGPVRLAATLPEIMRRYPSEMPTPGEMVNLVAYPVDEHGKIIKRERRTLPISGNHPQLRGLKRPGADQAEDRSGYSVADRAMLSLVESLQQQLQAAQDELREQRVATLDVVKEAGQERVENAKLMAGDVATGFSQVLEASRSLSEEAARNAQDHQRSLLEMVTANAERTTAQLVTANDEQRSWLMQTVAQDRARMEQSLKMELLKFEREAVERRERAEREERERRDRLEREARLDRERREERERRERQEREDRERREREERQLRLDREEREEQRRLEHNLAMQQLTTSTLAQQKELVSMERQLGQQHLSTMLALVQSKNEASDPISAVSGLLGRFGLTLPQAIAFGKEFLEGQAGGGMGAELIRGITEVGKEAVKAIREAAAAGMIEDEEEGEEYDGEEFDDQAFQQELRAADAAYRQGANPAAPQALPAPAPSADEFWSSFAPPQPESARPQAPAVTPTPAADPFGWEEAPVQTPTPTPADPGLPAVEGMDADAVRACMAHMESLAKRLDKQSEETWTAAIMDAAGSNPNFFPYCLALKVERALRYTSLSEARVREVLQKLEASGLVPRDALYLNPEGA